MPLKHFNLLGWALWLAVLVWSFLPVKTPVNFDDLPNEGDKVLVEWVAITGPSFLVVGETAKANLQAQALALAPAGLTDISLEGLELTGDAPWRYVRPEYGSLTLWALCGRIVGFTEKDRAVLNRRVPIFEVTACYPTTHVANLFHRAGWFPSLMTSYLFVGPLLLGLTGCWYWLEWCKTKSA